MLSSLTAMIRVKRDFSTVQRTTVALGTFVSIEASFDLGAEAAAALDVAIDVFIRIDTLMHPTRNGSDLYAIASSPADTSIRVHEWTYELLTLCQELWLWSGGSFDPCVPTQPGRLNDLSLMAPNNVSHRDVPIALDLGGIAKGFAIDRAVDALQRLGSVGGIVNAGGDVRVYGSCAKAIEVRFGSNEVGTCELLDAAFAVSGPRNDRSPAEHVGFYSPQSGASLQGHWIAVRAPLAAIADALTKCAIASSPSTFASLLQRYDACVWQAE